MSRLVTLFFISIVFAGCSGAEQPTTCPVCSNVFLDSSATIVVRRVLDGDTFEFGVGNDTIGVRLLGIDAFETRHGSHLDSQAVRAGISQDSAYKVGLQAKLFADSLLTNRSVRIYRSTIEPYADAFGRLLRYVFFSDGINRVDYDSIMLAKGFAIPD